MSTLKHHVVAAMSKVELASKTSPSLQAEYDKRYAELDENFANFAPVADALNKGMAATTPQALAERADALRSEHKPTQLGYPNPKVDALLAGSISLSPGTFTERDFVDLALAALDQAGVSASLQRRVNELVADELDEHCESCGKTGPYHRLCADAREVSRG